MSLFRNLQASFDTRKTHAFALRRAASVLRIALRKPQETAMHDLKFIRENPKAFDDALARRGLEAQSAAILALDEERRAVITRLQEAQARRNAASKDIGKAKGKGGDPALADKLMAEVAALKEKLAVGEADEKRLDEALRNALAVIPNLPAPDVPEGADEKGNVEVRRVGEPRAFDFAPKQHFEIGEALGLMDFEAAARMSGARFVVLKGPLARLERALAALMLDLHTGPEQAATAAGGKKSKGKAKDGGALTIGGYTEVNPPLLVKDDAMFGTGQLPKFGPDLFDSKINFYKTSNFVEPELSTLRSGWRDIKFTSDQARSEFEDAVKRNSEKFSYIYEDGTPVLSVSRDVWLIPTAEVSLTNLVRESVLAESDLPMRLTAHTPCFRAEAGAAGRDTRGIIRQHQFSKVELVSITTPEQSEAEHERMTACAEEVLKRLGLPFRTVVLCTGDMGFSARKTYDIEVWLPGQNAYREISSCSNCGDFQARRMANPAKPGEGARYRDSEGRLHYVHTLNGSGLAVGRTLVAVLENYQEADGSVRVPEALIPYMGGLDRIAV
jgi:seryl-tRNA synthetase